MNEQVLDLIIIGAGPTGLSCAIEAEKAQLNYLVLEKGVLANSIYNFPTNMTFFSTSNLLEIGNTPFISHNDKPTRREALEYYRRINQSWQLKVKLYEAVVQLTPHQNVYHIETSKANYFCKSVIVATGYYDTPRLLNIPGEDLAKVKHYYDDPHVYTNQKVLVIGAKNSACDVALETYHKGAEVTMAIRKDKIHDNVKYWIKPNIENRIKEGAIKAYFNTEVKAIHESTVSLETPDGILTIDNDFVLAMTGYQPDYGFIQKLGIQLSNDSFRTPIHNPMTLETNLPNIYIAGVLNAGLQTSKLFIENTRDHGAIIIQQIRQAVQS